MRGAKCQGRLTSAARDAVVWSVHWLLLTCSVSEDFRIIEKWPKLVIITIREMNRRFISSGDRLRQLTAGCWVEGIRRRSETESMAFMAKVGKLNWGGGYKNMDNKGRVHNCVILYRICNIFGAAGDLIVLFGYLMLWDLKI
ncbi:unnamed protein product [Malus baccata var. baccata]